MTNIKVYIQESIYKYSLEIIVTADTRNTFNYCKEYDLNEVIVLDDYTNNEKIGFKIEFELRDLYRYDYRIVEEQFRELIPPVFKKYRDEITYKFMDCLLNSKFRRYLRYI